MDRHHDESFLLGQTSQKYLRRVILPLGDFAQDVVPSACSNIGLRDANPVSKLIIDSIFIRCEKYVRSKKFQARHYINMNIMK